MQQLIVVAVFGLTFAIIAGAYWLFVASPEDAEARAVRRRLRTRSASVLAPVVKAEERLSTVNIVESLLQSSARIAEPLQRLVTQSGLNVTPGVLLLGSVAGGLLGFVVAGAFTTLPFVAVIGALICAAIPLLYVRSVASRRLQKFEEQFPEAIDLIARALRAGHALTTALQLAGDELPEPVGPEFQLLFDRQNYGMSLQDAMREFAARIPLLDARFFVTAVLIQRETGGNLSSVLDNLANVIRERFKVKRQVRVMSAHGRITGWALGLLPPAVGVLLFFLSPDLMSVLFTDPLGNMLLAVGFGLQVIGILIIRRILDVEF